MILKRFASAALILMAFATTSCIQSDQTTQVNPDGSGKFKFFISMDMAGLMAGLEGLGGGAGAGKMKDDPMASMMKDMISKSEGVDVWTEAKLDKDAAGKSKIVLAGYFKDISKLKLAAGGKDKGMDMGMTSTKDADGNWVIEMGASATPTEEAPAKADAPKLTDAEVKEKLEQMKAQIGMMKGMMEQMMAGAKMDSSMTVGGTVLDYGAFEKVDDSTGKISLKPATMFASLEKMLDDPAKGRALVESGDDPMKLMQGGGGAALGKDLLTAMTGRQGALRLVIKPGKPLFDYAKEVEAAKANQSPELKAMLEGGAKKEGGAGKVKLPKAA